MKTKNLKVFIALFVAVMALNLSNLVPAQAHESKELTIYTYDNDAVTIRYDGYDDINRFINKLDLSSVEKLNESIQKLVSENNRRLRAEFCCTPNYQLRTLRGEVHSNARNGEKCNVTVYKEVYCIYCDATWENSRETYSHTH